MAGPARIGDFLAVGNRPAQQGRPDMTRTTIIAIFAAVTTTLGAAQPAAAAPQTLHMDSRHQPVVAIQPLPGGGFEVRVSETALETASGRGRFTQALDQAAAAACHDVRPLRTQQRCIQDMVASTSRSAGPDAVRALRLARQEAAALVVADNK
jgi:hypothetical protein